MDKDKKKALVNSFLEKKKIGGIIAVRCENTGKMLVVSSPDLDGTRGRFSFAQTTGSCIFPKLMNDWNKYGGGAFSLLILESLEKKKDQTDAEYRDDLKTLLEMELEKHDTVTLY